MTASGESFVTDTNRRLDVLESTVAAQPDGNVTLNLVTTIEARVKAIEDTISKMVTPDTLDLILEAKLKTVIFMKDKKQSGDFHRKPILESKAVSDVDKLTDAKSYRPFNRKLKNAMEQVRPYARKAMEMLEAITEQEISDSALRDPKVSVKETIIDVYLAKHVTKYPDLEESLDEFNRDIWSVLDAKAEGEALGKLKSVQQGEGLMAFVQLHQWFIRT